jgi:hypothetical protein
MNFAFEAAVISVSIGAVLSVLLQGKVLDEAEHVPAGVARGIRAVDIWLATVFMLVIALTIAVSLLAIDRGHPLEAADRDTVTHLLGLAALYPFALAITRRTLPILFSAPEAPYLTARVQVTVLALALVGPFLAVSTVSRLIDPTESLEDHWLLIVLAGAGLVAPTIAAPSIAGWWASRGAREVRREAAELRLVERSVVGTLPELDEKIVVRTFVDDDRCWIDRREAERVLRHLREASRARRRRGVGRPAGTPWFVLLPWPLRGRSRTGIEGDPSSPSPWPRLRKRFFAADELLRALNVREEVAQLASNAERSAAKPG